MTLAQRIDAFVHLGKFLGDFSSHSTKGASPFHEKLRTEINAALHYNGWFTKSNVLFALHQWHLALKKEHLDAWVSTYSFPEEDPKKIAIIMAGNIPLVGFHDVLSVLITGHHALIKKSSNDQRLLPILLEYLISVAPTLSENISYVQHRMAGHEAVIATGSNNTSRYFDYYFKNVPNIIRKNRQSVAILTGTETPEELQLLSNDIFRYYGLGCRNVSKIFVPENYNFNVFFENIYNWKYVINDNKYANNYDYNKAVYLMSGANMLDNNYILVKEDNGLSSPVGVLFYEIYKSKEILLQKLIAEKDQLQCVVGKDLDMNTIGFGHTQHPELWDYADGVDTVDFLLKIH